MKTSELIAAARKYLWDGKDYREFDDYDKHKTEYICFALSNVQRYDMLLTDGPVIKLVQQTRDMIESRLFPWNNIGAWLQYRACIPSEKLTVERVQKHRLKWMNKLIKEYKAKGD